MIKRIVCLFVAVLMLVSLCPASLAENDGEEYLSGWNITVSNNASYAVAEHKYCHTPRSLMLKGEVRESAAVASTKFYAEEGKKYRIVFSCWGKAASFFSFSVGNVTKSLSAVIADYGWTEFEQNYTHKGASANVNISFSLQRAAEVYIDDIYVLEYTPKNQKLIKHIGFNKIETEAAGAHSIMPPHTLMSKSEIFDKYVNARAMPFIYMKNINIDASLDEWTDFASACLPNGDEDIAAYNGYKGEDDLSGVIYTAYDENNIYLAAVVNDNVHFNDYEANSSSYWRGDSVQVAIGAAEEDFGIEIGFYMDKDGNPSRYNDQLIDELWGTVSEETLSLRENTKCAVSREENRTVYEISIPWLLHFEGRQDEFLFNVLINDNDGEGRRGYFELTDGIGKFKNNSDFISAMMIEKDADMFGYIDGPKDFEKNSPTAYSLYIVNDSNEEKEFSVSFDLSEEKTEPFKLSAKSVYMYPFTVNREEHGRTTVTAGI